VRVLSRLLRRGRKALPSEEIERLGKEIFRTRNRSLRRTAKSCTGSPGVRERKPKRTSKRLSKS